MNVFHHASLLTIALMACACRVSTLAIPLAPRGVNVRPEVARGYLAYEAPLAPFGDWAPDRDYGVHWCPSAAATGGPGAIFQPYVSRGHWDLSETAIGDAPAGSPTWRSEDSDTWGEITTHHGWWIPTHSGASGWCWVPGVKETPAQVAWREDEEFVGWAALLPFWVALDDVDYDDGLDWVYTLVGTLLEGSPSGNTLTGKAKEQARASTGPVRRADGSFRQQRVGPSGAKIDAAKQVLSDYVIKHPDAIAAATATQGTSRSAGSSGSRSKSSSSSSSGSSKTGEGKDGVTVGVGMAPMPSSMAYYDAFQVAPPTGPAAVTARGGATGEATAARGGGVGGSGAGAGGEGRSASLHGEGAAEAHAGSRAEHPAATTTSSSRSSSKSGKGSSGRSSKSSRSSKSRR